MAIGTTVYHLATAIVAHLGDDWTAKDGPMVDGRDAWITHKDGVRRIHVSRDWREKGRLNLSGALPEGKAWSDAVPYDMRRSEWSITVSGTRTGDAIAKEITRRLLPTYSEAIETIRQRYEDHSKREAIRGFVSREIIEAFGQDVDDTRSDRDGDYELGKYSDAVRGKVRVTYPELDGTFDHGIEFTVRVPAEKAAMLARFLRTMR